jgi:hypothetical protein
VTDFSRIRPVRFDPYAGADGPEGLIRGGLRTRSSRRRLVCLREAADALDHLPAEGETLHGLMTGTYDLMHLLVALLDALGSPCETMRVSTLSLSARNVAEMAALLDSGKVKRLDLLCSDFFRKHDKAIFAGLLQEFASRGQRVAAARSHCKVVTLALEDGRRYALEGSANLRTNHNVEQFALARDPELFAWYDGWLDAMMTKYEVHETTNPAAG